MYPYNEYNCEIVLKVELSQANPKNWCQGQLDIFLWIVLAKIKLVEIPSLYSTVFCPPQLGGSGVK